MINQEYGRLLPLSHIICVLNEQIKLNEELKELRILGIERIDLIEVFKILRGCDNVNPNRFLLVVENWSEATPF